MRQEGSGLGAVTPLRPTRHRRSGHASARRRPARARSRSARPPGTPPFVDGVAPARADGLGVRPRAAQRAAHAALPEPRRLRGRNGSPSRDRFGCPRPASRVRFDGGARARSGRRRLSCRCDPVRRPSGRSLRRWRPTPRAVPGSLGFAMRRSTIGSSRISTRLRRAGW